MYTDSETGLDSLYASAKLRVKKESTIPTNKRTHDQPRMMANKMVPVPPVWHTIMYWSGPRLSRYGAATGASRTVHVINTAV